MDLLSILDRLIENKLIEVNQNGFMLAGHNGPYYDTETPVRNSAHWIITFSYYYKVTNDAKYFDAIIECADYLISEKARPMKASFFCRYDTQKDFANGTIGAAWAIEGLVEAYKVTKEKKYIEVAKDVFLVFPFDEKVKLWKVVNVDGSLNRIDGTFNHQLWFAAAGVLLLSQEQDAEIEKRCRRFFDYIESYFRIYPGGLVKHAIVLNNSKPKIIRNLVKQVLYTLKVVKTGKSMKYKENGYHLFNIYAFSLIKEHGFELELFKSKKFKKALNYCFSNELYDCLENTEIKKDINSMPGVKNNEINIYGYSYNAPGFELPYIYKVFRKELKSREDFVTSVIKKQLEFTFDNNTKSFCKNTEDSETLDARVYEYVRSL